MSESLTQRFLNAKQAGRFSGEVKPNEPLAPYTTYRIGGPADLLLNPKGMDDLFEISRVLQECGKDVAITVLGKGSNCLIADAGIRGLVVRAQALDLEIEPVDDHPTTRLRVGASVSISTLLNHAAREGWGGLELWAGIPGSVGGAVQMNAGTKLGWSSKIVRRVERYALRSGRFESVDVTESQFSYRKNHFLNSEDIVTGVEIALQPSDPAVIRKNLQEYLRARSESQPVEMPSCGSVFKNPPDMHAWQVIEKLGLKGHQIGGAQISPKHGNFIVNVGKASANDVLALIELIQSRALHELGVRMDPEVRMLGFG